MYIPESEAEAVTLLGTMSPSQYYLLAKGSNLLITDGQLSRPVINLTKCCLELTIEQGKVTVGASVTLRRFVRALIAAQLASPVELITIPGTLGGAIYQNAKRGRTGNNVGIADHLETVRFFDGHAVRTLARSECEFSHRASIFQRHKDWTILGATFQFPPAPSTESRERLLAAMQRIPNKEYLHVPSAGSVFSRSSPRIMNYLRGVRWGGARYWRGGANIILNDRHAKFSDVSRLIWLGKLLHRLSCQPCKVEIETWR